MPALRRGEADAVIASHAITATALKAVDFTDRYYHPAARFAGKRGGARLDVTPEGLEGKKIAVAKGTAHEAYARAFFRDSSIRAFETPELARDALITGSVDLLFDDGISLVFWLNGTASRACCEFKGGPFGEPKYFGDGVGIAVNREDGQLRMQINGALKKLRESGRFEELLLRYFPLRAF
jgi:polar amino acid transport system substrate-binding protein